MRIYLIGMMGSGKTTIGQLLSKHLNYPFYDTDHWIEQTLNQSTREIIAEKGIDYFRSLEGKALNEINDLNAVIACGGGIVTRPENIDLMRKKGHVIYLEADVKTLPDRLMKTNLTSRPLLGHDPFASLTCLMNERKTLYHAASDLSLSVDGLSIGQVLSKLSDHLKIKVNLI